MNFGDKVYLSTGRDKGSRQKNMKIGAFRNVTQCSVVEISNASKERNTSVFRAQEKLSSKSINFYQTSRRHKAACSNALVASR